MPDAVCDLAFHRTSIEKTDVIVTKPGPASFCIDAIGGRSERAQRCAAKHPGWHRGLDMNTNLAFGAWLSTGSPVIAELAALSPQRERVSE